MESVCATFVSRRPTATTGRVVEGPILCEVFDWWNQCVPPLCPAGPQLQRGEWWRVPYCVKCLTDRISVWHLCVPQAHSYNGESGGGPHVVWSVWLIESVCGTFVSRRPTATTGRPCWPKTSAEKPSAACRRVSKVSGKFLFSSFFFFLYTLLSRSGNISGRLSWVSFVFLFFIFVPP